MDDLNSNIKYLREDLQDIKQTLVDNTVKLATYNSELRIHIQASQDLHTRMIPLEDHVKFQRRLITLIIKGLSWAFGICASVATILRFWTKH